MSDSLIFADTDNDRIMRLSFADLNIYYLVANAGGTRFSEGIDPLAMAPLKPRVVDYNPITGKIFFVEAGSSKSGAVHRRGGEGASACRYRDAWVLRRRRPRDRRRVERPAGDRGRLPRQRLHRRLRQPRRSAWSSAARCRREQWAYPSAAPPPEGGAPFVARRAVNLHGCALPHCAPPPAAAPHRGRPPMLTELRVAGVLPKTGKIAGGNLAERTEQGGPRRSRRRRGADR